MSLRVVLLEGDEARRSRIGRLLEGRGYSVRAYATVEGGWEELSRSPPDLLITGVVFSDGNGFEFLDRLREIYAAGTFPVLVIAALRSEGDIRRVFFAGANEYIRTPVLEAELMAKVAVLVARAKDARVSDATSRLSLPTMDDLAFGRYEPTELLGRGGAGVVYRAKDKKKGREVALKVLDPLQGSEPENRLRFLRESYALSVLSHPNVVRVRDFGVFEGRLYYTMDFLGGPTLEQWVNDRGVLSEDAVVAMLEPLAAALGALHAKSLVHRDLKPRNIVFRGSGSGDPVLVDFGLVKRTYDKGFSDPRVVLGTPGYIAPEVVLGEDASHKSDLFALGMLARHALDSTPLFPKLNDYQILLRTATQPMTLPTCSEAFGRILSRLLAIDPEERTPSAESLGEELRALREPV